MREAHEEAGLSADQLVVRTTVVTAEISGPSGPDWTYTTVIADAAEQLQTVPNRESAELRWVAEDEVADTAAASGIRRKLGRAARRLGDYPADASRALSLLAAACGSSAAVIARTTTMRRAPASSTSGSRCSSMPPIANHGLAASLDAAIRTSGSPGAVRPGFVGVGQHGPTQK